MSKMLAFREFTVYHLKPQVLIPYAISVTTAFLLVEISAYLVDSLLPQAGPSHPLLANLTKIERG